MKKLLGSIVIWFFALYTIAFFADLFLIYAPTFPYADAILAESGLPRWIYSWANFDGVHYLTIVSHGYVGTGLIQAFFPLYPGLLFLDSLLGFHPILSGQALSLISFLGGLFVWQKMMTDLYGEKISQISRNILLVFPTSFFFMAVYTESLFLFLSLSSLYLAYKRKWWLAILAAALASGTRVVGIALVPALIIEYVDQRGLLSKKFLMSPTQLLKKINFTDFTKITSIFVAGLGLYAYMFYLYVEFKDPLYFFHVQEEFGGGRSESLVLLPQVIIRYVKILLTVKWSSWAYFTYVLECITSILALFALIYGWLKKYRPSHMVFASLVYLLPTLTGTFSSMPRYVLTVFPLFIVLADSLKNRTKLRFVWYVISSILLVLSTLLFIQGYWLA